MATIVQDDIIRVTARMLFGASDEVQNIYYVQKQGPVAQADADVTVDIAAWMDAAYTHLNTSLTDILFYNLIEFYNVTQDRPMVALGWPVLVQGDSVNDPTPSQMAAQVNFYTGVKRSVGKKYIAGYNESAVGGGGFLNPFAVLELAAYGAEIAANQTFDGDIYHVGHVTVLLGTFIKWLSPIVSPIMATQRRRKLGTGA